MIAHSGIQGATLSEPELLVTNIGSTNTPPPPTELRITLVQPPVAQPSINVPFTWYLRGKIILDFVIALILFTLSLPVLLLTALLLKLTSRGPVLYSQIRLGHNGRPFPIYKIRTMVHNCETSSGACWSRPGDPRVTRLGSFLRKTRLDEIPQVFAVFRGDMSFVGPRPERPFFVQQLKTQIPFFGLREAVKPGITGWAQIRYPYGATVEDSKNKLEYDLYYVQHQSLFLDLAICFHTVKIILFGRGAR